VLIINVIRQCEDIDHANDIFGTGPQATYLVLAVDLVPVAGTTTLVTPELSKPQMNARQKKGTAWKK